jgi:hypothetical protein
MLPWVPTKGILTTMPKVVVILDEEGMVRKVVMQRIPPRGRAQTVKMGLLLVEAKRGRNWGLEIQCQEIQHQGES